MRRFAVLFFGASLIPLFGCSGGSAPPGAPLGTPVLASGKIVFADGTPLIGGVIDLYPLSYDAGGGKLRYQAGSVVDAKGEFKLGRNGDGSGLVPGEYKVVVAPRDVGELPGNNTARIPKKHREVETADTITIEDKENILTIKLSP